jgi:hypothetical protein
VNLIGDSVEELFIYEIDLFKGEHYLECKILLLSGLKEFSYFWEFLKGGGMIGGHCSSWFGRLISLFWNLEFWSFLLICLW